MGDVLLSLGKKDKALDHYLKASLLSKNAGTSWRKRSMSWWTEILTISGAQT